MSGSIDRYKDILGSAQENKCNFLYETTAGAALPFIKSVKDFKASGDKIKEIEGVFSGTLAYLFNTFDGEKPFSEIVSNAKDQGYTEPDPRDDLSGMDVARKLVILAREMGQYIEVEDVEIENLVNKSHQDLSVEDYLKAMADDDEMMQSRYQEASNEGKALCYIAQLNGKGEASVTLKAIDQAHQFLSLIHI